MNVEVTVRIDGREVATLSQEISGAPIDMEQQTETLKDRVGQLVLPEAFAQVDASLRRPCCCGRPMHRKGTRTVTLMSQSGEIEFTRRRYRCPECHSCRTPADAVICCGNHRITRHLAKQICQLATLEHFTRLEQLMADQHAVHIGHDDMLQLVHDVGGVLDEQRQTDARWAIEHPSGIVPKVRPKQVYVSCDGMMYCTNQREPCPSDPTKMRLIWKQMRVGCVYWQDDNERWHKRVLWGQEELPIFAASLFQLACECGYREADEKIFIADGGRRGRKHWHCNQYMYAQLPTRNSAASFRQCRVLGNPREILRRRIRYSGLVSRVRTRLGLCEGASLRRGCHQSMG